MAMGSDILLIAYLGIAAGLSFVLLFGESVWLRGTIVAKLHWYITVCMIYSERVE